MVSTGKPVTAGHGPAVTGSDPHRHLTTLEGWRDFIHAAPAPPALVPGDHYAALDEDARRAYDDERLDYHTRLAVGATSTLRKINTTRRPLTLLNLNAINALPCPIPPV